MCGQDPNESCWTFLFLWKTTILLCFCLWLRVGQPLPPCWLTLVDDRSYGHQWSCSEWLVSSPPDTKKTSSWSKRLVETGQRMTILFPFVIGGLLTSTATATVSTWVSWVLWNPVKHKGVGLIYKAMGGKSKAKRLVFLVKPALCELLYKYFVPHAHSWKFLRLTKVRLMHSNTAVLQIFLLWWTVWRVVYCCEHVNIKVDPMCSFPAP